MVAIFVCLTAEETVKCLHFFGGFGKSLLFSVNLMNLSVLQVFVNVNCILLLTK